jgi:hypothetical protein
MTTVYWYRRRWKEGWISSHSTLLGLPDDLIAHIISALPVADQKSLALACSRLKTLVLQGSETLALEIRARGDVSRVSASLLAAIRRRHGKLSLRLTLAADGCDWHEELAALGLCPAVEHLELRLLHVSLFTIKSILKLSFTFAKLFANTAVQLCTGASSSSLQIVYPCHAGAQEMD